MKEKPIEEFSWKYKAKGIRCATCRECMRLYIRSHYKRNTEYYIKKAGRKRRAFLTATRKKLFNYLSTHPCVDCGESDPVVLEFDHIKRETKEAAISEMLSRQVGWSRVLAEIEKCEVRCANCHRRKTAKEQGWYVYLSKEASS